MTAKTSLRANTGNPSCCAIFPWPFDALPLRAWRRTRCAASSVSREDLQSTPKTHNIALVPATFELRPILPLLIQMEVEFILERGELRRADGRLGQNRRNEDHSFLRL